MTFLYTPADNEKMDLVITELVSEGTTAYSKTITNNNDYDGSGTNEYYYIDVETYNIEKCKASSEMGLLLGECGTLVDAPVLDLPDSWSEYLTSQGAATTYFDTMFADIETTMGSFPYDIDPSRATHFIRLMYLRDCYRNGWIPDPASSEKMYIIFFNNNELSTADCQQNMNIFLSFQTAEIRDLFLTNFRRELRGAAWCLGKNIIE